MLGAHRLAGQSFQTSWVRGVWSGLEPSWTNACQSLDYLYFRHANPEQQWQTSNPTRLSSPPSTWMSGQKSQLQICTASSCFFTAQRIILYLSILSLNTHSGWTPRSCRPLSIVHCKVGFDPCCIVCLVCHGLCRFFKEIIIVN